MHPVGETGVDFRHPGPAFPDFLASANSAATPATKLLEYSPKAVAAAPRRNPPSAIGGTSSSRWKWLDITQ
jgi:hypothetical protein